MKEPVRISVIGTLVAVIDRPNVVALFQSWLLNPKGRYVVFRDVHGLVRARDDAQLHESHINADLVVADGKPVVWVAALRGIKGMGRVCGLDLVLDVCGHPELRHRRHFFIGGAPGVPEQLAETFKARYPGLNVVGTLSPPFHAVTPEEDEKICATIRQANPDFLWVGLGTPKQELWMTAHAQRCGNAIQLGVGAVFDIHSGRVKRSPPWMHEVGLEWLYRLLREPRRLWRRYTIYILRFIVLEFWEMIAGPLKPNWPSRSGS